MTLPNAITLCADDYGLAPGIGIAIRDLIGKGRLQATGCMTGGPHWPDEAARLKAHDGMAEIGLHITLTDQAPLGPMPGLAPKGRLPGLGRLLALAHARRLDTGEIAAEIGRQYDSFEAAFGRAPDFLDGHQHVHVLPGIAEAVTRLWRERMKGKGWIRNCWEPPAEILARRIAPVRALVIGSLALGFRRRLEREGVPHNRSFRGVYDFSGTVPFAILLDAFIRRPGPQTLVMCHPGLVDEALRGADPLTDQREAEYRFLAGDGLAALLARHRLALARLYPSPLSS